MAIDLYTRVVFTVIAAALVGLLVAHAGPAVSAQGARTEPAKVLIAGWQDADGFIHPFPPGSGTNRTEQLPLPVRER